jgi:ubiquinone/menaquinone biosynthesis C-methylase UbiE
MFSDLSITYTGADQSEALITLAQEKFPRGRFVVAEMTELPFADQAFDIIYCIAAFQHLPTEESRLKALSEMKRVLVPGGFIIMTNWNLFSETASLRHQPFAPGDFMIPWKSSITGETVAERYYHGFVLPELEQLFAVSTLQVIEQYYSWQGEKSNQEKGTNIISIVRK